MSDWLRTNVLRWLRVPPEPVAPAGGAGTLRVFRAAPSFWRLRQAIWLARQVSTLLGVVVFLIFLRSNLADRWSSSVPWIRDYEWILITVEFFGVMAFLAQLPVSYLIARLDYELRWYLVTDRSLRIRNGVWTVEELTMTYANVQELTIHQNPLQRLLGIADLRVRSAGGGGVKIEGNSATETHVAYFHGVENAAEIRDLIQEHLRRHRDTGLGDPGPAPVEPPILNLTSTATLTAARELLEEARALRAQVRVSAGH